MTTDSLTYRVAARSDVGRARPNNEDSYLDALPLIAVADGMGGAVGGEVASGIAVDVLDTWRASPDASGAGLEAAVRAAHRAILERSRAEDQLEGMGTTVTAAFVDRTNVTLAHVGDSRAYLYRGSALQQLTEDDTLVQRYVQLGRLTEEEARNQPYRNYVTQALGAQEQLDVEVLSLELRPGDRLLLASDGLFGQTGMSDERIGALLATEQSTDAACRRLVEEANAAGGDDNITVVLLDAETGTAPPASDGAGPVIVSRPTAGHLPAAGRRRHRLALVVSGIGVAVMVLAGLLLLLGGSRATILVATYGDRVAVLEGTPGSGGSAAKGKLVQLTEVPVASLPETFRRRVVEGIPAPSRAEALRIVSGLPRVLGPTDTPPPTPTPPPVTPAATS